MSAIAIRQLDFQHQGRKLTVIAIADGIADLWRIDIRDGTRRVAVEIIEVMPETVYDAKVTGFSDDFVGYWMEYLREGVLSGRYALQP